MGIVGGFLTGPGGVLRRAGQTMPTYEYGCSKCGHQWEAFQSIKDDALKTCPNCGEDTAKRLVSGGAGFILKGGGWYSDLYASSKPSSSDSSSASSGSGDSSSSTSSDTSSSSSTSSDSSGSSSSSSSSSSD